jgi:4-hydroxy-4-methyl-2-oxoglutarate aldolase
MKRPPNEREAIRARFQAIDSSNVGDVLDELGLHHQGLDPNLTAMAGHALAGWAYTISGTMMPYEGSGDPAKMEACAGVSHGDITVWSGAGSGICYFGELIALGMAERGSVGAIVDGGVRDLKWLQQHNFPVFARYRTPIQSIGRWKVIGHGCPVYMPGATTRHVTVNPGDFILADEDGAIVIPDEAIEHVLDRAEELTRTEILVRQELVTGATLQDCLTKFGHV